MAGEIKTRKMATKIHTVRTLDSFLHCLANPNPEIAYLFLPNGFQQIKNFNTNIVNCVVYTDIDINGIIRYYRSFAPEFINTEFYMGPILVNISQPVPINIPPNVQNPIDFVTKQLLSIIIGIHIPEVCFTWTPDLVTETNIVS